MIRFMRLLVFFDLPVKTKSERKDATKFRKYLINNGFYMVQLSVYCRICNGYDSVVSHEKRLNASLPPAGSVRTLIITEKQYESMKILVGKKKPNEQKFKTEQLSLFKK